MEATGPVTEQGSRRIRASVEESAAARSVVVRVGSADAALTR